MRSVRNHNYWQCEKFCHNHYELQTLQCVPPPSLSLIAKANWARNWAAEIQHMHGRYGEPSLSAYFPYFKMAARVYLNRSRSRKPVPIPG